ncbi:MAG: exodeoxyribonuclease large subunit, partial [Actinomycetota bacterium]
RSAEETWSAITAVATAQVAAAGTALGSRAARVASRTHQAVARSDERLRARTDRLGRVGLMLERARAGIDERDRRVALLDPVRLLERGWSITTRDDGRPVRGIADVAIGERLSTRLADGTVTSTVTGTVDGTEEADGDEQH